MPSGGPNHQVLIQRAFLGDVVLSIPLIRGIKNRFPEDRLVYVCRKGLADLLRAETPVDLVLEISKDRAREDMQTAKQTLAELSVEHVFCPHPSPRSAWFVGQIKRAGEAVGFQEWWNAWAFSKRVKRLAHLPEALKQLSLLGPLHREVARQIEAVAPSHPLSNPKDASQTLNFRGQTIPMEWRIGGLRDPSETKRALLAPGSQWATKRWTVEGFAEVARALREKGYRVEWIGSEDERGICEKAAALSGGAPEENCAGRWSLPDLVKEMRSAGVVIANDSAAIHLAALAGTPVVAIFGPTVPAQGFRPWLEHAVLVQKKLACRPCGKHGHTKCPIGTHECMKGLGAAEVIEVIQALG